METFTEGLIRYFEKNLPNADISNAATVIDYAQKGGAALRDYLDIEQGAAWELITARQPEDLEDAMFLFRSVWNLALLLVDWDRVAARVAQLVVLPQTKAEGA